MGRKRSVAWQWGWTVQSIDRYERKVFLVKSRRAWRTMCDWDDVWVFYDLAEGERWLIGQKLRDARSTWENARLVEMEVPTRGT